jgi:hypothetical protein
VMVVNVTQDRRVPNGNRNPNPDQKAKILAAPGSHEWGACPPKAGGSPIFGGSPKLGCFGAVFIRHTPKFRCDFSARSRTRVAGAHLGEFQKFVIAVHNGRSSMRKRHDFQWQCRITAFRSGSIEVSGARQKRIIRAVYQPMRREMPEASRIRLLDIAVLDWIAAEGRRLGRGLVAI